MTPDNITGLIDEFGTDVYRFCCKLTGNKTDADDLYQETFLSAFEKRERIDPDRNPKAFLMSVAIKLWKSSRRKFARRQRLAPAAPLDEAETVAGPSCVEDTVISRAVQEAVRAAADGLPEKYRLPVYLYYTAEMDISGIAAALGLPSGTVKSRLFKARAIIKERLEENEYEPAGFTREAI